MKKFKKQQFLEFVKEFWEKEENKKPFIYGVGQSFLDDTGQEIAVRWQTINKEKNYGFLAALIDYFGIKLDDQQPFIHSLHNGEAGEILDIYFSEIIKEEGHLNLEVLSGASSRIGFTTIIIYPNEGLLSKPPVEDLVDASCRLAMISNLAFKPNEINLDGIFGLLPRLCYMSDGEVMTPEKWNKKLLSGDLSSHPVCIDKFPPMWWGTPIVEGVRIADTSRVRMGAYLPSGCTVMHEGFVNFNAGSKGPAMIEGRISAGVFTGADSDIGGGASIMGTLSGGGKEKITIGDNCLLGANSGIGISLGDRCTVEAGLYVTAGMYVKVKDARFGFVWNSVIKAINLSGKDDMLFIQNSKNGAVEVLYNKKPNKLNLALHS